MSFLTGSSPNEPSAALITFETRPWLKYCHNQEIWPPNETTVAAEYFQSKKQYLLLSTIYKRMNTLEEWWPFQAGK